MSDAAASDSLAFLNAIGDDALEAELRYCCGSERWIRAVAARRPFADAAAVRDAAAAAWHGLERADWLEAFEALGDRSPPPGDAGTLAATDTALRLYRQRFGHRFIAARENLAAEELLMLVRIRLGNDDEAEFDAAREQQRRITQVRLERMLHLPPPS
jgi:2-oxo-4-hydroxy-4-carboxy-5-ureidoimidazoline decarboxylase